MKTGFLFLALCGSTLGAFAQSRNLRYAFAVDTGTRMVHVDLALNGSRTGRTTFNLPDHWASETQLYRAVKNLRVSGNNAAFQPVVDSAKRTVTHAPGAALTLSYDLKQDWAGPVGYPQNFRAVIQPEFFQFTGYSLFVMPDVPETERVALKLDWSALPRAWKTGNSFHVGTKTYSGVVSVKNLLNSVFTAGDFRLMEQQVGGKPVYIAVRGGGWRFTDNALLQRVVTILQMERQFWNDDTEPYYFVSLIPFEGQGSMNGTSLHQAFMLGMTREQPLEDWLLAHEYFHRWNGTLVSLHGEDEQEHAWLSEGFTEYYTYKLLLTNGMLSKEEYLRKANEIIAAYYLSPVRNKDRRTVGKNFWSDGYKDLPYKQGFVYALFLDNAIRQASDGARTLDDVMRDLYRLSKTRDTLVEDDFSTLVSRHAGTDLSRYQRQYIDSGATIPVLPALFGEPVVVQTKSLGIFDAGFDIKATVAARALTGVVENGPAWNAGLRNGQKATNYSISRGNVTRPLEVTILDHDTERAVSYLPIANERVEVPQLAYPVN